jgi:hypothetical protein
LVSKQPLFSEDTAVPAFGDGGRFATYEVDRDGKLTRDSSIDVIRKGRAYDLTNDKGKASPMTFHPIRNNLFVAQASSEGSFAYVVFRIEGREAFIHVPDCEKQDKAKLEALGVEIRRYECVLDGVKDPNALFAILDVGPPASKMVRE